MPCGHRHLPHHHPNPKQTALHTLSIPIHLKKSRVETAIEQGPMHRTAQVLKGFDTLVNLVLDDTIELMRDPEDPYRLTGDQRMLGLIVARGTAVTLVCPCDGMAEIANPFAQQE